MFNPDIDTQKIIKSELGNIAPLRTFELLRVRQNIDRGGSVYATNQMKHAEGRSRRDCKKSFDIERRLAMRAKITFG